jgi:hypothetical protein
VFAQALRERPAACKAASDLAQNRALLGTRFRFKRPFYNPT